eukprot:scaffold28173_cov36-Prasinocladus_malaysianus.AAC.2
MRYARTSMGRYAEAAERHYQVMNSQIGLACFASVTPKSSHKSAAGWRYVQVHEAFLAVMDSGAEII